MPIARHLLWLDCAAATTAGLQVQALGSWLARLYSLPYPLLQFIGVVNLLYACYSGSLALRGRRPRLLLYALVAANAAWAGVCLVLALRFAGTASPFALVHLLGEAVFVGGLAACEWRWRELLLRRT